MFDNIGGKIKTVAVTLTWLGIVTSVLYGFFILLDGSVEGLFIMIFGSLLSWLGSFLLYGFGQLVENSDKLVALLSSDPLEYAPDAAQPYSQESCPSANKQSQSIPGDWVCFACGNSNFHQVQYCQACGVTKHWSDAKHAEAANSI